jgi:hypothetical protein
LVATALVPAKESCSVVSSAVSTFSVQVTDATSSSTLTSTSVRKNWMYGVLAMISAHERLIAGVPRTGNAPGCTHSVSVSSSHSSCMASRSPDSNAW